MCSVITTTTTKKFKDTGAESQNLLWTWRRFATLGDSALSRTALRLSLLSTNSFHEIILSFRQQWLAIQYVGILGLKNTSHKLKSTIRAKSGKTSNIVFLVLWKVGSSFSIAVTFN